MTKQRVETAKTKARVLIADDDADLADVWRRALELDGHEVLVVHDGDEALAELKSQAYDVAIIDVVIPEKSGLVVSGVARAVERAPVVIAVSGYFDENLGQSRWAFLADLGIRHILAKPVDLNALCELVGELASRDQPHQSVPTGRI